MNTTHRIARRLIAATSAAFTTLVILVGVNHLALVEDGAHTPLQARAAATAPRG